MTASAFEVDFEALTGQPPFPWQVALYRRFVGGTVPGSCDLPTGMGKTSVIVIWLLALVANPRLPRRLVYVVNRRTVVDQATSVCEALLERLRLPVLGECRASLLALAASACVDDDPVGISTLRGQRADNAQWRRDPTRPAIIVGTVDMIGSRLLFAGYGCSFRSRPLHAGFIGHDAILVHDEAHLEPAFQDLLEAIVAEQRRCNEPRPLQVMALTATTRSASDFGLGEADMDHPVVSQRLHARKGIAFTTVADRRDLAVAAADLAGALSGRTIVFLSRVEDVERCAERLRKLHDRDRVAVLTGTMRGAERDALPTHPVFARYMPRPPVGAIPQEGSVWLVATAAGEVGIDISSDQLVTDLVPFDALAQRLGRVNRYGEGDATIDILAEAAVAAPLEVEPAGEEDSDRDPVASQGQYEAARRATLLLLRTLPLRTDGRHDASPASLRKLPLEARSSASTPLPGIRPVDPILFDRWACTTLPDPLPGRPPVGDWLHGLAEWEPPRTMVAWREEVDWLTSDLLATESLGDLLADYPLRGREVLSDRTDRVFKHLKMIAKRNPSLPAWCLTERSAEITQLDELLRDRDPKKSPGLAGATVVLPPRAGGLVDGMLDGGAEYSMDRHGKYDLGPVAGEREVLVGRESDLAAPAGMRLVRALPRGALIPGTITESDEGADGESSGHLDSVWWCLYAPARVAEEVSSRTSFRRQTLAHHLRRTRYWADRIARFLDLPDLERQAISIAGLWHDQGKARAVWQASIRNLTGEPLAKGPMRPAELGRYRHELGSLLDVRGLPEFEVLPEATRELALHLIAAHHGRARPAFPSEEGFDPERPAADVAVALAAVPVRFDRLQRRYGRWGLAWLESLMRAADALASEDEEEAT